MICRGVPWQPKPYLAPQLVCCWPLRPPCRRWQSDGMSGGHKVVLSPRVVNTLHRCTSKRASVRHDSHKSGHKCSSFIHGIDLWGRVYPGKGALRGTYVCVILTYTHIDVYVCAHLHSPQRREHRLPQQPPNNIIARGRGHPLFRLQRRKCGRGQLVLESNLGIDRLAATCSNRAAGWCCVIGHQAQ